MWLRCTVITTNLTICTSCLHSESSSLIGQTLTSWTYETCTYHVQHGLLTITGMGTNSPGAIRYIGKYLRVACTLAMWNKMGFESKLAPWQYGFPRYKGKCLMVTDTTRYRRSWETIAKWYNVMHLLSLPYHVSHSRTGMRTMLLLGLEHQRCEPWALKQEHH